VTTRQVQVRRKRIERWINRMANLEPRYGSRHHVKLVDLGTHQAQRTIYAHNNNPDHQVEDLIGKIGRGPEADRLWAMLCAVTEDWRMGELDVAVVKSNLWSAAYDAVGEP